MCCNGMKEEVSISPRFILSIQTWFRINDYIAQSSNTCKGLEEAIMARYDSPVQLFAVEEVEGVAREGGTTKKDPDVIRRRKTKSETSGEGEFQIRLLLLLLLINIIINNTIINIDNE